MTTATQLKSLTNNLQGIQEITFEASNQKDVLLDQMLLKVIDFVYKVCLNIQVCELHNFGERH